MGYFCKIQAKKYSFRRGGLKIVRGAIEILKGGPYQFFRGMGGGGASGQLRRGGLRGATWKINQILAIEGGPAPPGPPSVGNPDKIRKI